MPCARWRRQSAISRAVGNRLGCCRDASAVGIESDKVGIACPMGVESVGRVGGDGCRGCHLCATRCSRVPAIERVARTRGRRHHTILRIAIYKLFAGGAVEAATTVQAERHDRNVIIEILHGRTHEERGRRIVGWPCHNNRFAVLGRAEGGRNIVGRECAIKRGRALYPKHLCEIASRRIVADVDAIDRKRKGEPTQRIRHERIYREIACPDLFVDEDTRIKRIRKP